MLSDQQKDKEAITIIETLAFSGATCVLWTQHVVKESRLLRWPDTDQLWGYFGQLARLTCQFFELRNTLTWTNASYQQFWGVLLVSLPLLSGAMEFENVVYRARTMAKGIVVGRRLVSFIDWIKNLTNLSTTEVMRAAEVWRNVVSPWVHSRFSTLGY